MTLKLNPDKAAAIQKGDLAKQLDTLFSQLPDEKQVLYGGDLAVVFTYLQTGRVDRALKHIQLKEVPDEDKPMRQAMLEVFAGAG